MTLRGVNGEIARHDGELLCGSCYFGVWIIPQTAAAVSRLPSAVNVKKINAKSVMLCAASVISKRIATSTSRMLLP